jgi:hypothetical protein
LVLTDDDLTELGAKFLIGFAEFVDRCDIVGWELLGEFGNGIHDVLVEAKLGSSFVLSRREVWAIVLKML